jgi:molybdenum cofactor cytidylyltransferase
MSLSLCAVILAAGESTRMGREKALLAWPPQTQGATPGGTFLSAAIESLHPFSDLVIVVAGKNAANLAPLVYTTAAALVINPAPELGQFSSLQTGLHEVLNRGRDSAIVTLVDRPPAEASTIERLRTAFELAVGRRQWAVVPEYAGQHGHPFIVGRELIEAFLRAPSSASAREIEHQHLQYIEYVPVADPFVTMNVDTPESYAALSASLASRK